MSAAQHQPPTAHGAAPSEPSPRPLVVVNPATEAVVAELPVDTPETVAAAVRWARAAQPAWAARPVGERVGALRRFAQLVEEHHDELATTLTSETGKPIAQSGNELRGVLPRIAFFCDHVDEVLDDERVLTDAAQGLSEVIAHEPLGVVANISAWNYPWFVGTNVFVPALLCGNAVVYKPSEHASLTGRHIAALLSEAGVPAAVFQPVYGAGEVGAALCAEQVDGVYFTGSYPTGRRIAEAVAPRMVRLQLELGGKDPVYVADDVPVAEVAAAVADGAFYNTGQSCCSVERVYVHRSIHDEFVEAFVDAVGGFVVGDPADEKTYIGPLTRAAQIEVLEGQVRDALDKGAVVRLGGHRLPGPGAWFEPTVLTQVDSTMAVMRDESFGPIIGIEAVGDDDEALARMNDTEFGLTAGIYTRQRARAQRVLAGVDAGSAYWNCCDRVSPRLPWTGRHHSGIGSTLSTHGIRAFLQPKAYHLRSL
jgi:acyl-CoA reductase-like NAD-dependent aldehyde dehydrogenase